MTTATSGNDNATNQWFDWLNEEKQSCCTCGTLFTGMFWRSLPNDDVKLWSFWGSDDNASSQQYIFHSLPLHDNHSYQESECSLRLFCTMWSTWSNRETLNLTQSQFQFIRQFLIKPEKTSPSKQTGSIEKFTAWRMNSTLNFTRKTDIARIAKRWVRYRFFKWNLTWNSRVRQWIFLESHSYKR